MLTKETVVLRDYKKDQHDEYEMCLESMWNSASRISFSSSQCQAPVMGFRCYEPMQCAINKSRIVESFQTWQWQLFFSLTRAREILDVIIFCCFSV